MIWIILTILWVLFTTKTFALEFQKTILILTFIFNAFLPFIIDLSIRVYCFFKERIQNQTVQVQKEKTEENEEKNKQNSEKIQGGNYNE